jgi:hypothetical protein
MMSEDNLRGKIFFDVFRVNMRDFFRASLSGSSDALQNAIDINETIIPEGYQLRNRNDVDELIQIFTTVHRQLMYDVMDGKKDKKNFAQVCTDIIEKVESEFRTDNGEHDNEIRLFERKIDILRMNVTEIKIKFNISIQDIFRKIVNKARRYSSRPSTADRVQEMYERIAGRKKIQITNVNS